MTHTMQRNPDIDISTESAPAGCYIHLGSRLMLTARAAKIPFGFASNGKDSQSKRVIVGLVIRNEHRAIMDLAIKRKHDRKELGKPLPASYK